MHTTCVAGRSDLQLLLRHCALGLTDKRLYYQGRHREEVGGRDGRDGGREGNTQNYSGHSTVRLKVILGFLSHVTGETKYGLVVSGPCGHFHSRLQRLNFLPKI